jgi:hypothetical protein
LISGARISHWFESGHLLARRFFDAAVQVNVSLGVRDFDPLISKALVDLFAEQMSKSASMHRFADPAEQF